MMKTQRLDHAAHARRGATLALVAAAMIMLLGFAALAVDLAMAFASRAEAQRIADSAALAGGSAFLDVPPGQATPFAEARAYEYALRHSIRGGPVDSAEVTVQVIPDSLRVRVWVERADLETWFAKILGIPLVHIGAVAAAQAFEAGNSRCLKPFAVPDLWEDVDDDANNDNIWDLGEEWELGSDPGDYYTVFDGDNYASATGYGGGHRDGNPDGISGDYGRELTIKVSNPQDEQALNPGQFYPWALPPDPNQGECDQGGGGKQDVGGATYRRNICACNNNLIELGVPYPLEPGNMIGPTFQGVDELMDEDPGAQWDPDFYEPGRGAVVNSAFGPDGTLASPRIIKVGLFDLQELERSGRVDITFNNFALLFLQGQASPQSPVRAKFMYFAGGEGPGSGGGTQGSLVLYVRLVE